MRPVGRVELAISPQTQRALHVSDRKAVSNLRTDTKNARSEAAQNRVLTGIVSDLLIGIWSAREASGQSRTAAAVTAQPVLRIFDSTDPTANLYAAFAISSNKSGPRRAML